MLTELHIENLGVVERLDLTLGPGMTGVTGETGAGKTMLVEAVELLVGGRADATIVRPGAREARVDGRFVVGNDELVLTRVVPADGRSRAYIDGRPSTVAGLHEAAAGLVDLHGQHEHQSLLGGATQRAALDAFGGTDLAPLGEARARLTVLDAELATLGGAARERAREIDLLALPGGRARRGRRSTIPTKRRGWPSAKTCLPTPPDTARPARPCTRCWLPTAVPATRSPPRNRRSVAGRPSVTPVTAWLGCSPSSTMSLRTSAAPPSASTRIPSNWPRCASAASCCAISAGSTATTSPR